MDFSTVYPCQEFPGVGFSSAGRPDSKNRRGDNVGWGDAEGEMQEKRKNGKVKKQEVENRAARRASRESQAF
jgi:hypothetical protein